MAAEEKAKAYDEALERAKDCLTDRKFSETDDTLRNVVEYIFPELAKSENERIREAIESIIRVYGKTKGEWIAGYDMDTLVVHLRNAFAYLEKQKESLPIPDKFSGLKSLMLQYLQSAANRKDDTEIERDTDLWGRKILDYVWKHSDEQKEQKHPNGCFTCDEYKKGYEEGRRNGFTAGYNKAMKEVEQKEQKPLTTEETELNSIAFLEQMGYTCIPPRKEQKPAQTAEEKEYVRTLKGLISDFIRDCGGCTIDTEYYQKICNWLDGRHIEQKQVEKQDYSGLNDLERAIHRGFLAAGIENVPVTIIKETAKECLAQMKPAKWGENDENMLNSIINVVCGVGIQSNGGLREKQVSWLKSIPERFNLQPKEEWSEEDKQDFDDLIMRLEKSQKINRCYFTSLDVDWLKSKFNGNSCK